MRIMQAWYRFDWQGAQQDTLMDNYSSYVAAMKNSEWRNQNWRGC